MQSKITMPYVCGSVLNWSEQPCFSVTLNRYIGFLMYPTRAVILSTAKQRTNRVENLDAIIKSWQRLKLGDQVGNKQRI